MKGDGPLLEFDLAERDIALDPAYAGYRTFSRSKLEPLPGFFLLRGTDEAAGVENPAALRLV